MWYLSASQAGISYAAAQTASANDDDSGLLQVYLISRTTSSGPEWDLTQTWMPASGDSWAEVWQRSGYSADNVSWNFSYWRPAYFVPLDYISDFDVLDLSGTYRASGNVTNGPGPSNSGILVVSVANQDLDGNAQLQSQLWTDMTTGDVWSRAAYGAPTGWTAWTQLNGGGGVIEGVIDFNWDGTTYQPSSLLGDTSGKSKRFIGPTDPHYVTGVALHPYDEWREFSSTGSSVYSGWGPGTPTVSFQGSGDTADYVLGTCFTTSRSGQSIRGGRFWVDAAAPTSKLTTDGLMFSLWDLQANGFAHNLLAQTAVAYFPGLGNTPNVAGWAEINFATDYPLTPGVDYVIACHQPGGMYSASVNLFASADLAPPSGAAGLLFPHSTSAHWNGQFYSGSYGLDAPNSEYNATWYGVDAKIYDTTLTAANTSLIWDGSGWNPITATPTGGGSGLVLNSVMVSANYTAINGDYVEVDATSGPITITIPHANGAFTGVTKTDSSANVVTVVSASGTIDGDPNAQVATQHASATFIGDGTNIAVVATYPGYLVPPNWTITPVTAAHTAKHYEYVLVDASAGPVTITMPVTTGVIAAVKKVDSSSNAVTVLPSSGLLNGAASSVLTSAGQSLLLIGDGTNVDIAAAYTPTGRLTATAVTSSIANGASDSATNITLATSYRLLSIQTSQPARVRLYLTAAARTADISRAVGTDPIWSTGVVLEFVTADTASHPLDPLVSGASMETTPSTSIPMTVTNNGSTAAVTVTLVYERME